MLLARVMGTAVSTAKHASMVGCKLIVVQPLAADRHHPDGDPLIAIDTLGAGVGEDVMITSDGAGTREIIGADSTPVRWSVMGIPD